MKMFGPQIGVLPWIACFGVAIGLSVSHAAGPTGDKGALHFRDFDPIDVGYGESIAKNDPCGEAKSKKLVGKTAWARGYDQALSGNRYMYGFITGGSIVHPELKYCREYQDQKLSENDLACCRKGFARGLFWLQEMLWQTIRQAGPKPTDAKAAACYESFGKGRRAASIRCQQMMTTKSCIPPQIPNDTPYLGCASLGYLAEIKKCPSAAAEEKALDRLLNGGALTNAKLPSLEGIEYKVPPPANPTAGEANPYGDTQSE